MYVCTYIYIFYIHKLLKTDKYRRIIKFKVPTTCPECATAAREIYIYMYIFYTFPVG